MCDDVENSDATARNLLTQVQSAIKQLRGPERQKLQRVEAGLTGWETAATDIVGAIMFVDSGAVP